ncbi:MAG: hypothetical protein HQL14_01250 [Candidatus Omnitrophica bacterium]|nr:hypothetical protein [Candidatus Omnitrophota bacterium]
MRKNLLKILLVIFMGAMAQYSFADTTLHYKDNLDGSRTLAGHVPQAVALSKFDHHADANEMMDLRIIVPLTNQVQLDTLLKSIYDPTSPNYHHFLTSDQFNQQFKSSDMDLNKLKSYFNSRGFTIITQSPNGTVLQIKGAVGVVEKTFGVHINHYSKNDGTTFFAPDANPTISTEIVGKVWAVGGMDNALKFKPHSNRLPLNPSQSFGQAQVAVPHMGTGPGGYLAFGDVQKAYNLNAIPSISDPSSLQNVALFELDGYLQSDIAAYESYFHLPNNSVTLQNVLVDGFNGLPTYNGGNEEVTLDIEELIGIAPWSINKIYVYEAPNTFQAWDDEWTKIANDNLAKIISCSWGLAEYYAPTVSFDNQIFQRMAAQGQEVFVASGDCGAYADCSTKTLSADEPSSQPFATGVGISALVMNSDGTYKSETSSLYGGGGVSMFNTIPSYQQAMASTASSASKVSKTMRNVPDVSLTADPSTAYAFYITTAPQSSGWYGFWGSSIAAPTWAAFLAQVNQGRVHAGQSIVGFLNPVLYLLAAGSKYSTDFHDIVAGNNQYYTAQAGFDDATGLGAFNGVNLYNDLVGSTKAVPPAVPTSLNATAGNAQVALAWGISTTAVYYNVKRSTVSAGPYSTISVSGAVKTGSYTDTSVANGTTYYYVVSAVNAAGESANSSQVQAKPMAPALSPPAAPTGLSVMPGNNQVAVSWNASVGATSYNVKRSTATSGPFTVLTSQTKNLTYVDTSAKNQMTYYYTVSALNAGGESPNSNLYMVTPFAPPPAPSGLAAVPASGSVTLSWNAVSQALWYYIGRSTVNGGPYSTIGYATANNFKDTTVVNGATYYYVVSTYINVSGFGAVSPNSLQVSATPKSSVTVAPVANLTGLATSYKGTPAVLLQWTQSNSLNITKNNIYGSVNGTTFSFYGSISATTGVYVLGISSGSYYVTAVNSSGIESQASNKVTVVAPKK